MNKTKLFLVFATFLFFELFIAGRSHAQTDVYVSYQTFYDDLSPYGQWIQDSEYGYVWTPNTDDDFRPYFTGGHWVMTDYGNTWVSDYPWGWACFHYGRWMYNEYYGWTWIPGYEWGPGWVAWRWDDNYCGWAPLMPGVVWLGLGYECPEDWWIFMHPRYLYRPRYHNTWRSDFFHGPHHTHVLLGRTHFVNNAVSYNNTRFFSGPQAPDINRVTHQPVQVYHLTNSDVHGRETIGNNTLSSYHPARVEQVTRDGKQAVPAHTMQAPKPVNRPGELKMRWNEPRQFKVNQQRKNPEWNRPFIRNAPPYRPAPIQKPQAAPRSAPARAPAGRSQPMRR